MFESFVLGKNLSRVPCNLFLRQRVKVLSDRNSNSDLKAMCKFTGTKTFHMIKLAAFLTYGHEHDEMHI